MFSLKNTSEIEINKEFTEYGECRCCMAKGQHRDVTKEYYYNNVKEVYKDIFMECFNLSLSSHNLISKLICSNCVNRLRDATSFRMMVVGTEEMLLNAVVIKNDCDTSTVFVDVPGPMAVLQNMTAEVKIENVYEEMGSESDMLQDGAEVEDNSDDEMDYDTKEFYTHDDFDSDSNFDASNDTVEHKVPELIEGETDLIARFPSSLSLPTRGDLAKICPEYVEHLKKLEDKIVKAKSLEWFLKEPDLEEKFISEKTALAINATALFENSNATAFKTKLRSGYPCFYCREIFNCEDLRKHQEKHPKSSIYKLLLKYNADELIVYADITDLKCIICNGTMKSLTDLKTHLYEQHSKKIYTNYPDRVIPYKLKETDFQCQVCEKEHFETFGALERHMNSHYGNFICEECGAGFITKHRLTVHTYTRHKNEKVICQVCKKVFSSQMRYRLHYDSVHKMMKKYKCTKCPEKFIDYFTRQKHLVDVHMEEPILYKCSLCEKGFSRKFSLSSHVKRCHLEQKDVKCQFCTYTCFTNSELKDHLVKHNGSKQFECGICKKVYGRNKSLVIHMRIHGGDQKFTCSVCGLVFVQMKSLKAHMKKH